MKITPTLSRLIAVSLVICLSNCAKNPVTGKRELSLMSTEQEIAIGKESHPSIVATMGLYEDPKLQAFMNTKGKAMAAISHRPDLPYQFYIVDSPVVNAFAVPGGYVYFTRGILAHFNNEAEFAGVLGHEIGHITARHSVRQQSSQLLTSLAGIAGAILVPQLGESFMQGAQLLQLSYSRAHESESDEIGVGYSSKIGYDANQMADFFATIKRIQDNSGQSVPNMLSTHPDPGNRYTKVHEMAKDYQTKNPGNYQVNRDTYLRMIDGIMYGEDPKQGFVENNMFYHPELKFQFPVPTGWQHQNSPSQFQMGPKDGKSSMIMMLAKGNSVEEAAQAMVKELNLKVLESAKQTVNGNQAMVIISQQLPQQQQQGQQPQQQQTAANTLQIGTYLIQYNGNIYALHGLSSAADFQKSFPTFKSVSEGFRTLTDPDKLNRKPDRVYVRQAPRAGTFREVMTAMNMPASRIEELGVVNSLKADERVEKGTLLKVITK
ncbi:M48 family metalloprotease [Fibrivirga algicola]|uniref:M48 family metalloprotease n=1 Tax=Fibrivirga algicola TaxID=2950420 RepID=A0ABX0QF54_9BACT|nr:M48 family metalloprotease [Fibrivirga algicola]NID11050.1 M48 family metalloprotease [Fibrivirga algicola]